MGRSKNETDAMHWSIGYVAAVIVALIELTTGRITVLNAGYGIIGITVVWYAIIVYLARKEGLLDWADYKKAEGAQ